VVVGEGRPLDLLLAQAAVKVTVMEKHGDFLRDFGLCSALARSGQALAAATTGASSTHGTTAEDDPHPIREARTPPSPGLHRPVPLSPTGRPGLRRRSTTSPLADRGR
jgi:hypothetical protein